MEYGGLTYVSPLSILVALAASIALPATLNLWLWHRDRRRAERLAAGERPIAPFAKHEPAPRVSFLVAAWNEADMIDRCIEAVEQLTYPDLELVLCAGGSDGTFALAARHLDARVKVIEQQPGEGKQHALQRCLEASTGSIVYLIDADCIIIDETFRQCMAPILREGEAVVTGSFYWPLPEQLENPFVVSQTVSRAYTAAVQPKYGPGLLGGNCVMRREALIQAGAFSNSVRTGTDYDLAKRLLANGQRIRHIARAWIHSELPTTYGAYFRQQARWIRNVVVHGVSYHDYGLVISSASTSIVGLVMLFVLPFALWLTFMHGYLELSGQCLTLLWLLAFFHALFARVRYQLFTAQWFGVSEMKRVPWQLPVFLLLDFTAWSLPLLEYPFQSLRVRW